jgi:hypothetical protein
VNIPGPVGSDEYRKSLGLTGLLKAVKAILEITPTEREHSGCSARHSLRADLSSAGDGRRFCRKICC